MIRADLVIEPGLADGLVPNPTDPILAPLVSPPMAMEHALGIDLILEGFLAHHGRPRELAVTDTPALVLAGDYCYAAGLVRVAQANDVFVIGALARLVALSAGLVATGRRAELAAVWLGTIAAIAGSADPEVRARLSAAVRRSTDDGDHAGFDQLAAEIVDPPDLVAVLA
jgi:hypothetical protein